MSEPHAPRRNGRTELGGQLRRLRVLAGLSGRQLAERLDQAGVAVSQSKVSRIEAGQTAPNLAVVRAWAQAASAPAETLRQIEWLTEQALNEVIPFREWQQVGLPGIQGEIRELEQAARQISNFQMGFVPGLLQTGEYARRVMRMAGANGSLEAALAARLERQQILHDETRRFEFILHENALRWHTGPEGLLAPQIDHLISVSTLTNVAIGVVPADTDWKTAPMCSFVLYEIRADDEPSLAAVETPWGRVVTTGAAEVQAVREELILLRQSAIRGAEAAALMRRLQS